MSDLISRSDVVQILKECNLDETLFEKDVFDKINNLPMAYSVDKVVKELEELKMRYFLTIANTGDEKSDFAYENVGNVLDKAIEIVKNGVVADDVCQWQSASDGEFIQNPHTKRLYSNEPSMQNVYCNTCGKKIKVVE